MTEMLNLDLTNYRDRVGSRVPEGRYTVLVQDAEMDKSAKGNPMVNLWLDIISPEEHAGATIVDRLTITDRALFRVVGFMQAIGIPTPKKRLQVNLRTFIGKTLDIDVADGEPYNGRVKSEVRGYMRSSGAASSGASGMDLDDVWSASASGDTAETPASSVLSGIEAKVGPVETVDDAAEIDLESLDLG